MQAASFFIINSFGFFSSLVSTGGKCLAKYSDGLWYKAIIRYCLMMCGCVDIVNYFSLSSLDEEFTVHIPSLNKTVQTPIGNVFPLGKSPLCLLL